MRLICGAFLREFEGGAFEEATVVGYPTADVLRARSAVSELDGQEVVPTVAGLLLFGRDERVSELLPRAAVTATRFSGDSPQSPVIERVKLAGNLLTVYEGLMRFVQRYCDLSEVRPKNGRAMEEESPVPARSELSQRCGGRGGCEHAGPQGSCAQRSSEPATRF